MQRKPLRQILTGVSLSKKAVPRQRGQAAVRMYYTMWEKNISLFVSPCGSLTCRANFVVSCGLLSGAKRNFKKVKKGGV